jgi:hypothetical protein
MIDPNIINSIAVGVVGWEQPTRSGSPTITAANKGSTSGLTFQGGHALCTIDNIKSAVDDDSITDANLNILLTLLAQRGLTDICNAIFTDDDHLDTGLYFKYESRFSDLLDNDVSFVGYQIDLGSNNISQGSLKRNDISIIIRDLILEMSGVGTVKVLLFNSQISAPIISTSITTLANTATTKLAEWTLNDLDHGGMWYVGYLRSQLISQGIQAIKRNYKQAIFPTVFPEVGIRPIRVLNWDSETMFDPLTLRYEYYTWGMNFRMSMYEDYTNFIKTNINRFAKALQLQVCVNVLKMISNSTRSNKSERLSKAYAMLELDGNRNNPNMPYTVGLNRELKVEIDKLRNTYAPHGILRATL